MSCLESGLSLQWTIENFHFFPKTPKQVMKTPPFSLSSYPLISWVIEIEKCDENLCCSLLRSTGKHKDIIVEFSLSLKINNGVLYGEKGVVHFKEGDDRQFLRSFSEQKFVKLFQIRTAVITCHLAGQFYPPNARIAYCYTRSHIEVDNIYYDWVIPDFENHERSELLKFPVSKTWKESNAAEIVLRLDGKLLFVEDLMVDVLVPNLDDSVLEYHCKVTILNCYETVIATAIDTALFNGKGDFLWRIKDFKSEQRTQIKSLFPNNILKFTFEFGISRGKEFTWIEGTKSLSKFVGKSGAITPELKYLLDFPDLKKVTDMEIVIGERIFSVHRAIICAVSPYFRELDDKTEGDVIELQDTSEEIFEKILNLVYLKDEPESYEILKLFSLYAEAQKFKISPLVKMLSRAIIPLISMDTLCDVLSLTVAYDDSDLQESAQNFFNANAKEVLDSRRWKTFVKEAPQVAGDIILTAFSLDKN